tara:strand:- start:2546 stop:2758 length:213 start_codon:yes stop_codon:yes gene_type:complete
MKKVKITIEGMHCASCGGNVEKALSKIEGVKEVRVSVMTNKGIVEMEDSVSLDEIKEVISKVGYKVVKVE